MTSHHSMAHNVAKAVVVEVDDCPETNVRVFPFLKNVRKLLNNPKPMEGSVWNADCTSSVHGEINTGSWWASAEKTMVNRMEHCGVVNQEKHKLCPLLFFIDGAHCDRMAVCKQNQCFVQLETQACNSEMIQWHGSFLGSCQ